MKVDLSAKTDAIWERFFPERRIHIRSQDNHRFIRLRPTTQAAIFFCSALLLAWTILSTAIFLIDSLGGENYREQAVRDQQIYQNRLTEIATERDIRLDETKAANQSFDLALRHVAAMQSELLELEMQRRELALTMEVLRKKLQKSRQAHHIAEAEIHRLSDLQIPANIKSGSHNNSDVDHQTINFLNTALRDTAAERDTFANKARNAEQKLEEIMFEMRLAEERNDQIFRQIEEAMVVSVQPLEKMFRAAGMNPKAILDAVRRGYSGYGGPFMSPNQSNAEMSFEEQRAGEILSDLSALNIYRIAIEKVPLSHPIKDNHRFTSGFGPRWGRMHNGTDFAAPHGTPIYSAADGVVIFAGRQSAYGRLIKIKHDFGYETRYAHLSKIRVKRGQKVSRGERIGDMGNTGRSTGTHLHYEIRTNGKAVNPMNYIKAAKNVF